MAAIGAFLFSVGLLLVCGDLSEAMTSGVNDDILVTSSEVWTAVNMHTLDSDEASLITFSETSAFSGEHDEDLYISSTLSTLTIASKGIKDLPNWVWFPYTFTWWKIFALISAVLGTVGNFLVMVVLFQRRAQKHSTDTLIGALALADFLSSIFVIPLPVAETIPATPLGHLYCKVVYPGTLFVICVTASIYTLVAISVERFIAVVYPVYFNRLLSRRLVLILVVFIWIWAVTVDSSFFVAFVAVLDPNYHICTLQFVSPSAQVVLGWFVVCERLIFPAVIMLLTQISIARTLHHQSKLFRAQKSVSYHAEARNRVVKLMLMVILVYIVCWSPNQISFLLFNVGILPPSFFNSPLDLGFIVLSFCNSCINPVIYTARFPAFRVALRQIFSRDGSRNAAPLFGEKKSKEDTDITDHGQETTNNA